MTNTIIITLCALLLFAYLLDITSSKTKIPAVILLLTLGVVVRQASDYLGIHIPNLSPILPILGTVGLILIVLEGALELQLNKSKIPVVVKSLSIAILPILILSFGLAYAFQYFTGSSIRISLTNAIPLAIISSAIAIPSARNLSAGNKEFITYESSWSDIFGVIFFNFVTFNDTIDNGTFGHFFLELLIMLVVSFVATLALSYFLHKITHHIKFVPIILFVIFIYAIAKEYNLPALIFILFFGLLITNIQRLRFIPFIQQFHPADFKNEIHKFSEITVEMAFLVRALFFLLFGYLIEINEVLNPESFVWAISIVVGILILRFIFLKIFRLETNPLVFIAPRGLITILVFMSIPEAKHIAIANNSLVIQIILLTAFIMMLGLMFYKQEKRQESEEKI